MAKTLVIAEKPSVGRDLSRVLPGPWAKHEGYLEGPEHVLTWAVDLVSVRPALAASVRRTLERFARERAADVEWDPEGSR